MRKALLTSSEVSVLVSICVVVLFTLALFLSGYTVQQRTLQDLRVAIHPGHTRPSPRAHLPGYFERATTRLEDGTVVVGRSQADVDEEERLTKKYELRAPTEAGTGDERGRERDNEEHADVAPAGDGQASTQHGAAAEATEEQKRILRTVTAQAARQAWGVSHPDPLAKNPLPITKAERRKLIKEEIQRLAQAERPVYYQRRLW
ncbi:hypothetical protein E4U41_003444 [Claviceps citrina]|nr:hypothetical protein E4U41_003444 [Claviceps citrina]